MAEHDSTKAPAAAEPINSQVIARITCIKCKRENVPMRWDWSTWRHNGPNGKPCAGNPELQMVIEMDACGLPVRPLVVDPLTYHPSKYRYQDARARVSSSALRLYVALILFSGPYTYDELCKLTGIPKRELIDASDELLAAGFLVQR